MSDPWPRLNARRHALIDKEFDGALTPTEMLELEDLQCMADAKVRPLIQAAMARLDTKLAEKKP